jgi:hypothetical protein
MPGFNQRGPMNEGPMTGRGRGICTGASGNLGQGVPGRGNAWGNGRGPGNRGRGYGQRAFPDPVYGDKGALQNRVDMLEAELSAIKNQLKNQSNDKV